MPQPSPNPRRVLLAISVGTALSLLGDTTLYTVLPTRVVEAGVALASVGILLSANRWIRLPFNRPGGRWIEKLPRKPIFTGSLLIGSLTTLLYALSSSFWPLMIGRLLWGLAWIGIWIGGNTIALDISDETNRGRRVGIYQVAFFIGAGGGSIVGGLLTDLAGYHGAMGINAAAQLAGAVFAWVVLPETRPQQVHREEPAVPTGDPPNPHRAELASATALLAASRLVMEGFLLGSIALYLQVQFGDSVQVGAARIGTATITGIGLGLATIVAAISAPAAGAASDRGRNRWSVVRVVLLPGILGLILLQIGTPVWILIGMFGVSSASAGSTNLSTSLIGDLGAAGQHGRRLGNLFTVADLASAIGPPLVFALIPWIGLTGIYWLSAGIFTAMVFLAMAWSRR